MSQEENKVIIPLMACLAVLLPIGLTLCFNRVDYGSLALVSILASMVILRFDSIKNFSILGLLKAELELKIREANATLRQLKDIALASSKVSMREMEISHFPISSPQFSDSHALRDEIISSLESIGVSPDELQQVQTTWKRGVGFMVQREVTNLLRPNPAMGHTIRVREPSEDEKRAADAINKLGNVKTDLTAPPPPVIRQELEKFEISSEAHALINELLSDYESFLRTGVWNDPSRFDLRPKAK